MATIAYTPYALASSITAKGRNVYLSDKHFWTTMLVAAGVHIVALVALALWPDDSAQLVPVRTLNIKIGDEGGWKGRAMPLPVVANPSPVPAAPTVQSSVSGNTENFAAVAEPKPAPKPATKPASKPVAKKTAPKPVEKHVNIAQQIEQRKRPTANPTMQKTLAAKPVSLPKESSNSFANVEIKLPDVPMRKEPARAAIAQQPTQYIRSNAYSEVSTSASLGDLAPAAGGTGNVASATSLVPASGNVGSGGNEFAGLSEKEIKARYTQNISSWIRQHQIYPDAARQKGERGEVILRIRIDRLGNIKFSSIERPTGYALIDSAALTMVQRANPVPPAPADYPGGQLLEFLLPVKFGM